MIQQEKSYEEIRKGVALTVHKHAYKEHDVYNLPYRIMYDYLRNLEYTFEKVGLGMDDKYILISGTEIPDNEVILNPYYPFAEVPEQGEWDFRKDGHYKPDEWLKLKIQVVDGKKCIPSIDYVPPQIQALIDAKGKPYRLWDLETEAGQQAWVYYFMVFIMPYAEQIPLFDVFAMYGDAKHSKEELKHRIAYYMDLIARCKEQPELYKHDIQTYKHPLDILYYERDMIPNYKKACKDTSNRAYRIEQIINLLEQDSPKLDAQEA